MPHADIDSLCLDKTGKPQVNYSNHQLIQGITAYGFPTQLFFTGQKRTSNIAIEFNQSMKANHASHQPKTIEANYWEVLKQIIER